MRRVVSVIIFRIAIRITGDEKICRHNVICADRPPPMHGLIVVCLGNRHASGTDLQHDDEMAVIIYPQNVANFNIFVAETAPVNGSGRQAAESLIA